MDVAITRWKFSHATAEDTDPKPTIDDYDSLHNNWRSKDKVTKFLGLFSSKRFHTDWRAAVPDENQRDTSSWTDFVTSIHAYYKPTENATLKNFHFRELCRHTDETFTAFCNRVELEASHCYFNVQCQLVCYQCF